MFPDRVDVVVVESSEQAGRGNHAMGDAMGIEIGEVVLGRVGVVGPLPGVGREGPGLGGGGGLRAVRLVDAAADQQAAADKGGDFEEATARDRKMRAHALPSSSRAADWIASRTRP